MPRDVPLRENSRFVLPAEMDERWALVARVWNSALLRRSAKLRDLLVYLCHRWWVEGVGEVREQEIGVDVFQRPPNYDSAQDTLVRVQASQLRKRLERYFQEEGREEPVVLEIAKGTYEPVLRERLAEASAAVAETEAVFVKEPLRKDRQWPVWLLSALCVVLAAVCVSLVVERRAPAVEGASLRRFWKAFAPAGEETTVVIADAAFSAVQDMLHRPILLNEYVSRGYRAELDRPQHSAEQKDTLRYLMERRYTSLADVMLIKRLWAANVLDPKLTSVSYSRDLHLRSFEKGNHILVGSRRAVPWVDLFDKELDFHFVYDERTRTVRVVNRRPRAGEPGSFVLPESSDGPGERFSLVVSLRNPGKSGNVLILSGQEMSGTEAAATLVTTDRLFQEVLAKLPPGDGGVPYFEALLRVKHVEYTMQGYEILAVHPH
ncbi:MAG: hypothetical protein HY820_25130 [Acidobacteria bacterium]|nr:hypothetical protein [Acidobacteriota bacterium]